MEQASLTPAVRKYIALAADCSYPERNKSKADSSLEKRRQLPINAPPLTTYRAADCAKPDTLALKRVLLQVPTFTEAAYSLGNVVVWLADQTGGDDANRYYEQTRQRFLSAAGVRFMSGWLSLNIGDCDQAVRFYDEALALQPLHNRALLQKTICLSRTHQDTAAIASATRLIALEIFGRRSRERRWLLLARRQPASTQTAPARARRRRHGEGEIARRNDAK